MKKISFQIIQSQLSIIRLIIAIYEGLRDINSSAFENCIHFSSVLLPEGIQQIFNNTFRNYQEFKRTFIPPIVSLIKDNAFANCTNLQIEAPKGSYAYDYALRTHINVKFIK